MYLVRPVWHLQNRTRLRHLLLIKIFPVYSVQIVLTSWSQLLERFTTLCRVPWFFNVTVIVCRGSVEFVTCGEIVLLLLLFLVGVGLFFYVAWFVGGVAFEWLIAGVVGLILILNRLPVHHLTRKLILILRIPIKRHTLILILDPGDNLLPHMRLMPRKMTLIRRTYIPIRLIGLGFYPTYTTQKLLSAGGLCHVLIGCLW